jgi:antitoxin (DNA-binding transcriptional repressor) of toxin-antitoxin stability system
MVTFEPERVMSAVKATNLKLEELPPRVQAALKRGETVAISGAEGKVAELVPFVRAKRRLGALAGQSVLLGDIEAPTNEPWEAMQE